MGKRFLIADDHSIIRSGVKTLLESLFNDAKIDEAKNGTGVTENLKKHSYDMVIMDVQMPGTDALDLVKYIDTHHASTPVLIFSMTSEEVYALMALKAGARGFVSKEAPVEELKKAIQLVLDHKKYMSPAVIQLLASQTQLNNQQNPFSKLSPMEFKITQLLLEGKAISEIAAALHIQISTASTYKSRTFNKLNVSNLMELKELSMLYRL